MSKKPASNPPPLQHYGSPMRDKIMATSMSHEDKQLFFDRYAFANRLTGDQGAPPRSELFKRISDRIIPGHFEWHSWTVKTIDALCGNKYVGMAGCSGSAKTTNVVGFACTWWLCYPAISSVILCSTTTKALRKRGWAEVQKYHSKTAGGPVGNFVDSKTVWQYKKGDERNAIFGIAVEEGATFKVADNIKGIHTRRQMVIVDEATAVPAAIFEAVTNLYAYPEEFILVVIGNPRSRLDQMGKFCEPMKGWGSVSIDTDEWETKPQLDGTPGVVLRFDAEKSPNITEGKIVSKHLPTKEKVMARKLAVGGENDPSYWSNDRGFWSPEGLTKTCFSESALIKHDGYGTLVFTGRNFMIIGVFDPAYGGDRAAIRFAKLGEVVGAKWGIQSFPPIVIPVDARSSNPIHFQLFEGAKRLCEKVTMDGQIYSCPPENLAVDDTGAGGVADIMQRMWKGADKLIRIEFGGSPSDDPISPEDVRIASDVYLNKRAEMHFRARIALDHEQLKGIDQETAIELCALEYDDSKSKIKMELKSDFKARFGRSPDFGDTEVMLLEVARQKGFRLAPMGQTVDRGSHFSEQANAAQAVYDEVEYRDEEIYQEG